MEWMSTQQAADKWHIPKRTIQYLCKSGKIPGAQRFNGYWLIPLDTPAPESMPLSKHSAGSQAEPPKILTSLLSLADFDLIFNQCPYALTISRSDGLMLYANHKFMEGVIDEVKQSAIGHYNILEEPRLSSMGIEEHVRKAFSGQTVTTTMLPSPKRTQIGTRYEKDQIFSSGFHHLISYPAFDDGGKLAFVVTILIPQVLSSNRSETLLAKDYIDKHSQEPFNAKAIAKASNLSVSRLSTLYKAETGKTLHEYYLSVKIGNICRALLSQEQSITDVFASCGASYNSHYTKIFKAITGLTPSQYRKKKKTL